MKLIQLLTIAIAMMMSGTIPQKDTKYISSVETKGNWVYLYDAQGHRYKSISASTVGEVKGFSSTFFVSEHGNWVYLWNSNGSRYKSLSKSTVGVVTGVAGDTFTSKNGNWIYTWNKDGKRINSRSAR